MTQISRKFLLFLLVFSFSLSALSQEKMKILTLKEVLNTISKQHKIGFNYIEDLVENGQIAAPNSSLSLEQKLEYLKEQTGLDFEIVSGIYIVVSAKKEKFQVLDSISFRLDEIAIERYLAKGISKTLEGSFIVKPKEFGILPGLVEPDILQTMQQIPGIYSADETISNINVRSGTHDQNLFLWNGIRMFQTGHFFGMISAFDPSLGQKITLSKNGTSAFYGESVSSLVAISTISKDIENSNSSISSNLISASFNTKVKTAANSSFQISGRRSFTDLATSPTYQNYYDRVFQNTVITDLRSNETVKYHSDEKFYFYDFTGQYQHKIGSKTELIADFIGINNSLDLNQNSFSETASVSKNSNLKQENFGGNITLKTIWNDKNSSQINGYTSYYNLNSKNEVIENDQVLEQQNSVFDTGLRIENKHILTSNLILNAGYQYNEIGIRNKDNINNPVFSRNIKEVLRSHALVLENEFRSENRKVFLKTGLRSSYIEEFNQLILEPRLQFNYAFSDHLTIEILGEKKSQTTSQVIDLQQDFLGVEKRRWVLADDSTIPIQKSNQISVGFTLKNKNWLLTLDNYYKKVSGISSTSQAFQNQLELQKINGDYTAIGSEILVQRNFNRFYSWLTYSFSNSEYIFDNFDPSQFPNNFQIVHSISWAGIYEWKDLKMALGSKWNSGRPETTPLSNGINLSNPANPTVNYNTPNNKTLEDYFQVNFSASYALKVSEKSNLQLGISVLNIFDNKNIINRYYRTNSTNTGIESVNTYSLKRTFNASVKLNL